MVEKRGISFQELTAKRLDAKAGDGKVSPIVDRLCWFGLEAEAEMGKRGIQIDDPEERAKFLLDRLEEGLDSWNA